MGQTGNNVAPAGRMAGFCRFGSDGGPVLWRARGGLERWALHEWKKSENTWRMNGSHPQLGPFHTGLVFIFFFMRTIFKVFIEFVTILLPFFVLVFWLQGMWNLSSPTGDRTHNPCTGNKGLTTRPPGKPQGLVFKLVLCSLFGPCLRFSLPVSQHPCPQLCWMSFLHCSLCALSPVTTWNYCWKGFWQISNNKHC